uniref:BUB1 N-terminal domain-containing protein n=1 Tax=Acrobeloides nanus TaxID=290746 RepID=A0A914DUG1_9BILA
MATSTPVQLDDWFANVENLRPLRGGRRAHTLNEFSRGPKVSPKDAEAKFRQCLNEAKSLADPLSAMCDYLVWFEEHFPSGKPSVLYPMLYKICTIYGIMSRYENDERILKLWLKLAESFPERGLAVMDFAHAKGSCRQMANFYVRWSEMYEMSGSPNRAREILYLGINMRAAPLPTLHKAIDALEAILLRDSLKNSNSSSDMEDNNEDVFFSDEEELPARQTFGRLQGLGKSKIAPVIRVPHGPPGMLKSKNQSENNFEIFVDNTEVGIASKNEQESGELRLADELSSDPDYQSLFGYLDHRAKVDLHLTIEENLSQPKAWTKCRVKSLKSRTPTEAGFMIYSDDSGNSSSQTPDSDSHGSSTSLAKSIASSANPKVSGKQKMRLKKCYAFEMSIEEGYARMLYPDLL